MGDEKDKSVVATKVIAATMLGALASLVASRYPWLAHAAAGLGAGAASLVGDRPRALLAAVRDFEGGRLHTGYSLVLLLGPSTHRPPSEAEVTEIERRFNDPFLHSNARVITRAFLEALEDEALVPLATLARMYLLERRRVDRFYRSAAEFLVQADSAQLSSVALFVGDILRLVAQHPQVTAEHVRNGDLSICVGETQPLGLYNVTSFVPEPGSNASERLGQVQASRELIAALESARIGEWSRTTFGWQTVDLRRSELERLAVVLGIDDNSAR